MENINMKEIFEAATAPSQEDKERLDFARTIKQNIISQSRFCTECGNPHPSTEFFSFKDGSKDWQCKVCRCNIDINNEDDIKSFCRDFNIPYIKEEWQKILKREKEKYNGLFRKQSICGKYLSLMKLMGYKKYSYEDSDELNELREQKSEWEKTKQNNPNLSEYMDIIEKLSQIGSVNPIPYEELKTILPIQEEFNLEKELAKMEEKYDVVNKPKHYNREGGFESIEEMEMVFGIDATMNFCLLNVWKYRYRAADKNGEEDLRKSDWYMRKYKELKEKKNMPTISSGFITPTIEKAEFPYKPASFTTPNWSVNEPSCKTEIQNY